MSIRDEDLGSRYIADRQKEYKTPYQEAMERAQAEAEQNQPSTFENMVSTAGDVAKDIGLGVVETPWQIVGGVMDAGVELTESLEMIPGIDMEWNDDWQTSEWRPGEARSATGKMARGVSQFLGGFLPAARILKGVGMGGQVVRGLSAGAVSDAFAFDPELANVSSLIQEYPQLENPINEYLATDKDDPEILNRLRNAVEGAGLGLATEAVFKGLKLIRASRKEESVVKSAENSNIPAVSETAKEGDYIPFEQKLKRQMTFNVGKETASPEDAMNINLDNLETGDDVKALIEKIAQSDSVKINQARRQKISNDETKILARNLGMSVDDLLARRQGQAFNAEEAYASRQLLIGSAENLQRLGAIAAKGTREDVAIFAKALKVHQAIQQQVSGMTAEAGRTLQQFNIKAGSTKQVDKEVAENLDQVQLDAFLRGDTDEELMRDFASRFAKEGSIEQVNISAFALSRAKGKDMLYEYWINSLLSSPATHVVNFVSNMGMLAKDILETQAASTWGRVLGKQYVAEKEAGAKIRGMIEGFGDGLKLAWRNLRNDGIETPMGDLDTLTKAQELDINRKAISGENIGQFIRGTAGELPLVGTPIKKGMNAITETKAGEVLSYAGDLIGRGVRTPGAALQASDDIFKSMNYRMHLNAVAHRKATDAGLQGADYQKMVKSILDDPPMDLKLEAMDHARYMTFTNDLSKLTGKSFERWRNARENNMMDYARTMSRVLIPFLRTPVNIAKVTLQNTPLGIRQQRYKDAIAKGGAEADLARAKVATGTMFLLMSADLYTRGVITAGGAMNDWHTKEQKKHTQGWQPFSVKVGDEYIALNRLEPLGTLFSMGAQIAEVSMMADDDFSITQAWAGGTLAAGEVFASKTMMTGVTRAYDALTSLYDPQTGEFGDATGRYVDSLIASLVPSAVGAYTREQDKVIYEAYDYVDRIRAKIGQTEGLYPKRDLFGRPLKIEGGWGFDFASPMYITKDKNDPIADEIFDNEVQVPKFPKSINNVELTPQQRDEFMVFSAGMGEGQKPLREELKEVMSQGRYKALPTGRDSARNQIIRSVITAKRSEAKGLLIKKYPELKENIILEAKKKQSKATGIPIEDL